MHVHFEPYCRIYIHTDLSQRYDVMNKTSYTQNYVPSDQYNFGYSGTMTPTNSNASTVFQTQYFRAADKMDPWSYSEVTPTPF